MWQGRYQANSDIAAQTLFNTITDINSWSKWGPGLEYTCLEGSARHGAVFTLNRRVGRE